MTPLTVQVWKFNGVRLGNIMLRLYSENNIFMATSEAEISGYYKEIMLNRELGGRFL